MTTLDFNSRISGQRRERTEFRLIVLAAYPIMLIGIVAKRAATLVSNGAPRLSNQRTSLFREAYTATADAISVAFST